MTENLVISKVGIFDRKISVFSCKRPKMQEADGRYIKKLSDWLFDGFFDEEVEALRNSQGIDRISLYNVLPVASIGCYLRYDYYNRKYYPVCYTGLLDFDIGDSNMDLERLKSDLSGIPQMAYVGFNTDCESLFCIIPILAPCRYDEHFEELKRRFHNQGYEIKGSKDVRHCRYISKDPAPYCNPNAETFICL